MSDNKTLKRQTQSDLTEIAPKTDQKLKMLNILGEKIKSLQQQITPIENQTKAYIDPQVVIEFIANDTNNSTELDSSEVSMATVDLDYVEGFPVVGGLPFWERLDCEPLDYYNLYKIYRNQKLTDNVRSFEKLIDQSQTELSIGYIHAISKIYHWQLRIKYYDAYQAYVKTQEKDKDIQHLEGKHKKAADKIFTICTDYLDNINATGQIGTLKPNELLGWLELAVKLDRISSGLPPDKPLTKEETNSLKTIINIDQSKTQNQTIALQARDSISKTQQELKAEHLSYLQEIVNVLGNVNSLPKEIAAEGDVINETYEEENNE